MNNRTVKLIAFFTVFMAFVAAAEDVSTETEISNILTLTDENFSEALTQYPVLFVDFYAHWCGVCKKFDPRWKEIAKNYANKKSHIKFASINADANRNIASQYEISSYPTLILFYEGHKYFYEGAHEENLLEEFIDRISDNPAPLTEIPVQQVWISDKLALYVTTEPDLSEQILEAFEQASRVVRFMKFYIAEPSKELNATLKYKEGPIFLTKRRGAEVIPFKGDITASNLISFFSAYK